MLDQALAELEATRARARQTNESLDFMEESLSSFEEENRALVEELETLKSVHKKTTSTSGAETKELRHRVTTLEERVKSLGQALATAEESVSGG